MNTVHGFRDEIRGLVMDHLHLGQDILADRPRATAALRAIYGKNCAPSGFSKDFHAWCGANGYADAAWLARCGFGGRIERGNANKTNPVILVPGNGCDASFMEPLIQELLKHGYNPGDVYAMTYNMADPSRAHRETHKPEYVAAVRQFIEAVTAYTGRVPKVVGHSMGVTIAQLAIHGVAVNETGDSCCLGARLKVLAFYGVAGANQGLEMCRKLIYPHVSNEGNGFHPESGVYRALAVLPKVARHIFSVFLRNDDLLKNELESARINHQDGALILPPAENAHLDPIRHPSALVRLISYGHGIDVTDKYEALPRDYHDAHSVVGMLTDVGGIAINSAEHLLQATAIAAFDPQAAALRLAAAGATLAYGAGQALAMPFRMARELVTHKKPANALACTR